MRSYVDIHTLISWFLWLGRQSDRIISVIPITQFSALDPSYSVRSLRNTHIRAIQQLPKFVSYDGQRVNVEWTTPDACPLSDGDGDKPEDSKPGGGGNENPTSGHVGSGIGWFFLMLLSALAAYFAIGAYYNYSTYGARGLDLIPHRDFWQEMPYMLRDVVSHLCSNVGARRASRSGYIAV